LRPAIVLDVRHELNPRPPRPAFCDKITACHARADGRDNLENSQLVHAPHSPAPAAANLQVLP
jgi:hypothetical protein